ncbi:FidL-like protein [Pantoea sp. 1.19]|uniref:FidL-like protein n=1 Tax=Pantoea sp. 1.19 TaxID=1925589 RepID=UPI000948B86E|nr:FidL-like protein [Pantoea sp. 1.19]
MNLSRNALLGWGGGVILLLLVVGLFSKLTSRPVRFDHDCSTMLSLRDQRAGFSATLNVYVNMQSERNGYVDLNGEINYKDKKYTLARAWKFNYIEDKKDTYLIKNFRVVKRASDNADDSVVSAFIFNVDSEIGRYMKIKRFNNAYLISNLYSPLTLCTFHP